MTDNADKPDEPDEKDKPQRPNANYKLSKPDTENIHPDEPLTFHYNREHRLAKAPQAVKDLYANKKQYSRFNLLRPLIADKPRAILFSAILVICALMFILSLLGYFDTSYSLSGNKIEINGTVFEGATIIVLRKTVGKAASSAYTGAVDIAVSPPAEAAQSAEEDYRIFYHRVFFTLEPVEVYRFAVPFDSPELLMVLQTDKSSLRIKFKTE